MRARIRGYLFAALSAVIYGLMPLMAKYIYADGVTPVTLVFLRNALALPILVLLALREKNGLSVPLRALPSVGLLSLMGCAVTPSLLFSSYRFIPSGSATVIHFAYPAIVVVGGILFFGKKATPQSIFCVSLCVVGVLFFYDPTAPLSPTGAILALASALTFATYVLLLDRFPARDRVKGFSFCFYVAVFASFFTLLFCLFQGGLSLPRTPLGWALCSLFALLVTCGAVALFQNASFAIGGEKTAILSTLEPITGFLVGVLVFSDPVGIGTVVGSVLVVVSGLLIPFFDLRRKKGEKNEP